MQNVWYHLRRPTLVRRIIIAQMLLLTLLWCLFLTFILWEDLRSPPILTGSKTNETVFTLVERMDGRPQDRTAVLEALARPCGKVTAEGKIPRCRLTSSFARIMPLFLPPTVPCGDNKHPVRRTARTE